MHVVLLILATCMWMSGIDGCPVRCHCTRRTTGSRGLKVVCRVDSRVVTSLGALIPEVPRNTAVLDLTDNELTRIPEGAFTELILLKRLILRRNKIEVIEPGAFEGLKKLEKLDLSGNKLSSVDNSMFIGLPKLKKLSLGGNQIKSAKNGTFSSLGALKRLDIQSKYLVCDCQLQWIVGWIAENSITMPTKCSFPSNLKNQRLSILKKEDLHCDGLPEPSIFDLSPSESQVVFEGDKLPFICKVQVLDSSTKVYWVWGDKILESEPPSDIEITNVYSRDRTIVSQKLVIKNLQEKHSGRWTCQVQTSRGNLTKHITITVMNRNFKYCPATYVITNRGRFFWPKTLSGVRPETKCPHGAGLIYTGKTVKAYYKCSMNGQWTHLNDMQCQYTSKFTRILEQSTLIPLNESNIDTRAKRLVGIKIEDLRDRMDIVFITRNIARLSRWVETHSELARKLVDSISMMSDVNADLLKQAQQEEGSCTRMIHELENLPEKYLTESKKHVGLYSKNIAMQAFKVNANRFRGATCVVQTKTKDLPFNNDTLTCTMDINRTLSLLNVESLSEKVQAVIQLPSSVFDDSVEEMPNIQFIVYRNQNLFPWQSTTNGSIRTYIIGIKIGSSENTTNLVDPVKIILKSPSKAYRYSRAVFWDDSLEGGLGGWSSEGCEVNGRFNNYTIIICHHLSSFALIEEGREIGVSPSPQALPYNWWKGFLMMEPIVYVSSGVTILCLMATILTYCFYHSHIKMPGKLKHSLVNTCISTVLLMITFTMGVNRTDHQMACRIVGILLHYFSLTTLFWMTIMSCNMYKKFKRGDKPPASPQPPPDMVGPIPPKPMLRFYLLGWGIAVIVCGITAAVNVQNYQRTHFCFLAWEPSLGAFYAPAGLLVLLNSILFILIACLLHGDPHTGKDIDGMDNTENESLVNQTVAGATSVGSTLLSKTASSKLDVEHRPINQLRAFALVLFLFLITWTCGGVAISIPFSTIPHQRQLFSYAYGASCAILGIFVVVFYCLSRDDARYAIGRFFCCTKRNDYDVNNTQMNLNVTTSNGHLSNGHVSHVHTNGHVVQSEASINDTDSAYTNRSAATSANNIPLKNTLNTAKNSNLTQNTAILEPQLMSIQENFPSFYNPRQNGVARKYWQKNRRKTNMKLLSKEINTDKNSVYSSNDNFMQDNVCRPERHSYSSNDGSAQLNIDINACLANQINKQSVDQRNIYRPNDLPLTEITTTVLPPQPLLTNGEVQGIKDDNKGGTPPLPPPPNLSPLPTPPNLLDEITPRTEKKLTQIFSPTRESAPNVNTLNIENKYHGVNKPPKDGSLNIMHVMQTGKPVSVSGDVLNNADQQHEQTNGVINMQKNPDVLGVITKNANSRSSLSGQRLKDRTGQSDVWYDSDRQGRPHSPARSESHRYRMKVVDNSDNQSEMSLQNDRHKRHKRRNHNKHNSLGSNGRAIRKPRSLNWDDQFRDSPKPRVPYVYVNTSRPQSTTPNGSTKKLIDPKPKQWKVKHVNNGRVSKSASAYGSAHIMYSGMYSDSSSSDDSLDGSNVWVLRDKKKSKKETSV